MRARIISMMIISAGFLAFTACEIYIMMSPDLKKKQEESQFNGKVVGSLFLLICVLMTSLIVFLFIQIEKKRKALGQDSNFCEKEKRILFTILLLFNLVYLIRASWDFTKFGMNYNADHSNLFKFYLLETLLLSIPDFLTIAALLALHRKNFLSLPKWPVEEEETTNSLISSPVLLMAVVSQNQELSVSMVQASRYPAIEDSLITNQSHTIQK